MILGILGLDGLVDDLQFNFLSIVFQLYQDEGWVIIKGCVQWTLLSFEKISALNGN